MPVKYTLIDGAFFERMINEIGEAIGLDLFSKINWLEVAGSSHRSVYFDALPVRKPSQSDAEFEEVKRKKIALFNKLRSTPNFHVRDGITRLKTSPRAESIGASMEQKGVDTWIAVEAMQIALTGLADSIDIYTSDSDIYPVFEAIQQTRCRANLWYQEGRTAEELIFSADSANRISISKVLGWSRIDHSTDAQRTPMTWEQVGEKRINDLRLNILDNRTDCYAVNIFQDDSFVGAFSATFLPLICEHLRNEYGARIRNKDLNEFLRRS